jgi:hypothetical protein
MTVSTDGSTPLAALLCDDLTAEHGRLDLCTAILRAALRSATARHADERTALRLALSALKGGE